MGNGLQSRSKYYRVLRILSCLLLTMCGSDSNTVDLTDLTEATSSGSGLFQGYNSLNSVNITDSAQPNIQFDQTTHHDVTAYTHSSATADQITILEAATYSISYSISFFLNYNNRVNLTTWVNANGTEIQPTRSYCYGRNTATRRCTAAASFIYNFSAGDIITMQIDAAIGATFGSNVDVDVIANESWITIRKL